MEIYKTYEYVARVTGLSEIKLHQLRIAKKARAKTTGHPDYIPLICLNDVVAWIDTHPPEQGEQ